MSDTEKTIDTQTDVDNPEVEDTGDASERNRAWFLTLHIKNFENLQLNEDFYKVPPQLAKYLSELWSNSGKDRSCAIVVCESANGTYHVHMACYCKGGITRNAVRKLLGKCHCDAQLSNKKQMTEYLLKMGKHSEKGEKVLSALGLDNIQNAEKIDMLTQARQRFSEGYSVNDLLKEDARYYRNHTDETIKKMYLDKMYDEMPLVKDLKVYWHCGQSGSGKTQVYRKLVKDFGEESVYYVSQHKHGAFDMYLGEPILFIDELRPYDLTYAQLLNICSDLKTAQVHSRYSNKKNLWTTIHLATIYKPYEFYKEWFSQLSTQEEKDDAMHKDPFEQMRRRLTSVIYHRKLNDESYTSYEIPNTVYHCDKDIYDFVKLENEKRKLMAEMTGEESTKIADELKALSQNKQDNGSQSILDSFGAVEI